MGKWKKLLAPNIIVLILNFFFFFFYLEPLGGKKGGNLAEFLQGSVWLLRKGWKIEDVEAFLFFAIFSLFRRLCGWGKGNFQDVGKYKKLLKLEINVFIVIFLFIVSNISREEKGEISPNECYVSLLRKVGK